jgi:hypothetical protein
MPLNAARLRTKRNTAFCWELTTWAVRTSSAVRPNLVRAPVAVTSATASLNQGPRERLDPGAGFDRYGFASQHGSIEQDVPARELYIGRNHAAQRELHDVTRDQFDGGHGLPCAVAPDGCVQRQPQFQGGESRLRAALLERSKQRVEDEKSGDNRGLDIFAEHQFEPNRRLQHPRHGRPELFECHSKRMCACIRHRVGAAFRQPCQGLVATQAR